MRIVAHGDMDAFFAAVEERDHPWLKGRPIVVGADPKEGSGRGVVSTANYAARNYGIHSAMPITRAWRLAKEAEKKGNAPVEFIGVSMKSYGTASKNIMDIIRTYSPAVEEASIDEAYFDLSFAQSWEEARKTCQTIKDRVFANEHLTLSVGIGPNKLMAKIASDMEKPNGLTLIPENKAESFLESLSIRKIPGIGPKTEDALKQRGVYLIRDLKKYSVHELEEIFGKRGIEFYERIRGRDDSPIVEDYEIKSIGQEETFDIDSRDPQFLFAVCRNLCEEIIEHLKKSEFRYFRTITIKVRFSDFETKTRAYTLSKPINSLDMLIFEALRLFMPFLDKRENREGKLIRLVGVRIEKLSV